MWARWIDDCLEHFHLRPTFSWKSVKLMRSNHTKRTISKLFLRNGRNCRMNVKSRWDVCRNEEEQKVELIQFYRLVTSLQKVISFIVAWFTSLTSKEVFSTKRWASLWQDPPILTCLPKVKLWTTLDTMPQQYLSKNVN